MWNAKLCIEHSEALLLPQAGIDVVLIVYVVLVSFFV